jgi:hypothetical protein
MLVHVPDDHGATDVLHVDADSVVVRPRRHPGDTYPSLWFWFCVRSPEPVPRCRIEIQHLTPGADTYEPFWKHCLWSRDGMAWARIPDTAQRFGETTLTVEAPLPAAGELWIAATYPLPLSGYDSLFATLATPPASGLRWQRWTAGRSVRGRPIEAFRIERGGGGRERPVLVIAGQHAVEQSGKIFAETILRGYHRGTFAGTPMAALLERHPVVVVPMANPDGCFDGRMNTNAAGTVMDTATDDSPEMQAALAVLDATRPVAVINCHGWGNEQGSPPYEDLYRWSDIDPLFAFLRAHLPGCNTSSSPHLLGDNFRLETEAKACYGAECIITELNWNAYVPPEGGPPCRPTRAQIEQRAVEYWAAIASSFVR